MYFCHYWILQFNVSFSGGGIPHHSLLHVKITASLTKSFHQDCDSCFFFLYKHSLELENKNFVVITVFLSKLYHRTLSIILQDYSTEDKVYNVYSNCVWILKWLNLHCNWINLISVFNFSKQWVADYRCIFRTLSNI